MTALLIAYSLMPTPASPQVVIPVRDPPTCGACAISLEHLVTLGVQEGPGRVMKPTAMAIDGRGNFLVAHGDGASLAKQIWVFDKSGAFVRTIGRDGEGPGEYRSILRIDVLPGDTLQVYDDLLARRTTLLPDLTVGEIVSFEASRFSGSARLPDGRLALIHHIRTPERVGYPFQLVGTKGQLLRSFGSVNPEYRPGEPMRILRLISPGWDAVSFWSVGLSDYLIEQWDTTGVRLSAFRREARWFEPYLIDRAEINPTGPPPQPQVWLFKATPDGQLWIIARRATSNWREVARGHSDFEGHPWDLTDLFDWVLEVVEPSTGRLLVSEVLESRDYVRFLGRDKLVSYREDEDGYPFLDIWRLTLTQGAPQQSTWSHPCVPMERRPG